MNFPEPQVIQTITIGQEGLNHAYKEGLKDGYKAAVKDIEERFKVLFDTTNTEQTEMQSANAYKTGFAKGWESGFTFAKNNRFLRIIPEDIKFRNANEEAGFNAAMEGKTIEDNPNDPRTYASDDWQKGFLKGKPND